MQEPVRGLCYMGTNGKYFGKLLRLEYAAGYGEDIYIFEDHTQQGMQNLIRTSCKNGLPLNVAKSYDYNIMGAVHVHPVKTSMGLFFKFVSDINPNNIAYIAPEDLKNLDIMGYPDPKMMNKLIEELMMIPIMKPSTVEEKLIHDTIVARNRDMLRGQAYNRYSSLTRDTALPSLATTTGTGTPIPPLSDGNIILSDGNIMGTPIPPLSDRNIRKDIERRSGPFFSSNLKINPETDHETNFRAHTKEIATKGAAGLFKRSGLSSKSWWNPWGGKRKQKTRRKQLRKKQTRKRK